MLQQLTIKNYATVDSLELEFEPGMSVITGETGAGKSIILGALGLTLGDRADKTIVRSGASRAEICADFDTAAIEQARQWLADNDLTDEDERSCFLRRIVGKDGRSKAYINGSPVTLANLKTLGEMLLDIHSQHEHQSLLHRSTHQRMLDDFAVDQKALAQLQSTWKQWQQNHQQITELSSQSEEYSAQSQLLAYQLSELDDLDIAEDEAAQLEAEFKSLNHADEILSSVQDALNVCAEDDEHNATSQLNHALAVLRNIPQKNARLDNIIELLTSAEIQLGEAVADLRDFNAEFEADPERLEQVNARLATLHGVARKHKIKPDELPQLVEDLRQRLGRYSNSDAELEQLQANDKLLRKQFQQLAGEVSSQRKKGALQLAKQVNKQLQQLGMPHASVEVSLRPNAADSPNLQGLESVEFLVSTNPGEPAKPLIKIASGGELSRISLAIQVITAQTSHIPSLVFDEVDVGIGGGVAKVVGELLRGLGAKTQILCVTHQAQVAGQGHHHFFVSKQSKDKTTLTQVQQLGAKEKVKEVARMLGGEDYSEESLAHAQQMLAG
jgi:DNA repair protein RecN (Recombination protein N)